MKHCSLFPVMFALSILSLVSGCSKDNSTEPVGSEEELFAAFAAGQDDATRDLFLTDVEALDETTALKALLPNLQKAGLAPITPLRWGRRIDSVSRALSRPITMLGDTMAIAHVTATINGRFIIQAFDGQDTVVIQKPYTETLVRNLRFERVARTRYARLNWRLDAVSVINGGTASPAANITKVEVVGPNNTLVVTDPDNYFLELERRWVRQLPVFNNVPVTIKVTVESSKPDAEIVALHHLPGTFGLHHTPFTMSSETQNAATWTRVYEKSWTISGSIRKFAHLMVSATTRESLHDNGTGNFSSTVWGIPYKHSN